MLAPCLVVKIFDCSSHSRTYCLAGFKLENKIVKLMLSLNH